MKRHIDATLGQGNIKEAVRLPPGEDLNEWLAVNTVDFYNAISILYGSLEDYCTPKTCPAMAAGSKVNLTLCTSAVAEASIGTPLQSINESIFTFELLANLDMPQQNQDNRDRIEQAEDYALPQYEYLWADGVRVKTPIKLSAPDYINALFDWVEVQV